MQTFLPYENFKYSAEVLDYRRLGKQRVEVYQLLKALNGETKKGAWRNHPACVMWENNIDCLVYYGLEICKEWISRGYKDTCYGKIAAYGSEVFQNALANPDCGKINSFLTYPSWINDERVFSSHRSNLLRKDEVFYTKYGWEEGPDLEYFWPGPG